MWIAARWLLAASAVLFLSLVSPFRQPVLAGPAATAAAAGTDCSPGLTLTLTPGYHWPGAGTDTIPADLPPGNITLRLPLYPGATTSGESEEMPTFGVPVTSYMKSASAMYVAAEGNWNTVQKWYEAAFTACGYKESGHGSAGKRGVPMSQGISEQRQEGKTQIQAQVSFARAKDGGTLILYVAFAIVPPVYPAPGEPLRVPGTPVALSITRYSGLNPGPHALRPLRTAHISNRTTVQSLAAEINKLPKLLGGVMSCPLDDGSHLTLVFTDADGSTHVVTVGLQGCQTVSAPPAPAGRLYDDPKLLPRLTALLKSPQSHAAAPIFDARTLHPIGMRLLAARGAFLSSGQSGTHLLYLSAGRLMMAPTGGGTPHLLARNIADASFAMNDFLALALPLHAANPDALRAIDTRTDRSHPFYLPAGSVLLGRNAGAGTPGIHDALSCDLQYIWFRVGRKIAWIDPEHPNIDRYGGINILPPNLPGRLIALSCQGMEVAIYEPGRGLIVRTTTGSPVRRVPLRGVSFLSWAPDAIHLAYRIGATLFVLNVNTGRSRPLLNVGGDAIHGATWDPWSHVLALSLSAPGQPASTATIRVIDANGAGNRTLPLPFTGATAPQWSVFTGRTIGLMRVTAAGTQAWAVRLPRMPQDPGAVNGFP